MNAPRARWRAGTKVGRTLYLHLGNDERGQLIGMMDTPELAQLVCDAVNEYLDRRSGNGDPSQGQG